MCWVGPNAPCQWSGWAPGSWVRTGERCPKPTRSAVPRPRSRSGVTFFDTADVYGDGRSEQLIGRFVADNSDVSITVATKMGRRMDQVPENYSLDELPRLDRPLAPQPRCGPARPGPAALPAHRRSTPATRSTTRSTHLVSEGAIASYGVSVETVDEALTAMARRGTATVQIILNAFRLKPLDDRAALGYRGRGRDHRPGAAGERAAERQVHRRHDVRGERPPQLQPRRRGLRRRRDLLRGGLRDGPAGGAGVRRAGGGAAVRGARRPRRRWPGWSSSRASRP